MTAEVKYYLDLDDVLAVQLECRNPKCGVRSSFPVAKLTQMPYQCPHCNADWVSPDTNAGKIISAFLRSLGQVAEALQGQPCKLSLEVNYDEPEEPI